MSSGASAGEGPRAPRALRVQAVFHIADEHQAKTVAARMIDRVHEIANLPEFECDVDVSVELAWDEGGEPLQGRPGDGATGGPPPEGRPVKP